MSLSPQALERRAKRYLLQRTFDLFIPVVPGFESVTLAEVAPLVLRAQPVLGGIEAHGGLDSVYNLNLRMRVGGRVLLRLATFLAQSYPMLYDHARKVPWEVLLGADARVAISASATTSRLRHMDHIAQVVFDAARDRLAGLGLDATRIGSQDRGDQDPGNQDLGNQIAGNQDLGNQDAGNQDLGNQDLGNQDLGNQDLGNREPMIEPPTLRVLARLERDRCTLSFDTTGVHLHRRGYRLATARAPIRETLAAGLLRVANVSAFDVVVDPFTGAGTLAIEADGLLRGAPAGERRGFAIERAPIHRPGTLAHRRRLALAQVVSAEDARVLASDLDARALDAARANAQRAGAERIRFRRADALDLDLDALLGQGERGLVVANLPYGVRLGSSASAGALCDAFLRHLTTARRDWTFVLVTPAGVDVRRPGIEVDQRLAFRNGGLDVIAAFGRVVGREPSAGRNAPPSEPQAPATR